MKSAFENRGGNHQAIAANCFCELGIDFFNEFQLHKLAAGWLNKRGSLKTKSLSNGPFLMYKDETEYSSCWDDSTRIRVHLMQVASLKDFTHQRKATSMQLILHNCSPSHDLSRTFMSCVKTRRLGKVNSLLEIQVRIE
jgi:hypothetical protein